MVTASNLGNPENGIFTTFGHAVTLTFDFLIPKIMTKYKTEIETKTAIFGLKTKNTVSVYQLPVP